MATKNDGSSNLTDGSGASASVDKEQGMPASEVERIFVDGVQSIASHNGVHRIVFFHLAGDGRQNEAVLELIVPASSVRSIGEALIKAGR